MFKKFFKLSGINQKGIYFSITSFLCSFYRHNVLKILSRGCYNFMIFLKSIEEIVFSLPLIVKLETVSRS